MHQDTNDLEALFKLDKPEPPMSMLKASGMFIAMTAVLCICILMVMGTVMLGGKLF